MIKVEHEQYASPYSLDKVFVQKRCTYCGRWMGRGPCYVSKETEVKDLIVPGICPSCFMSRRGRD